jgi:hypothetical protein
MGTEENYGTIWVCVCCMLTHANGSPCCEDNEDAHKRARDERGRFTGDTVLGDGFPLSSITAPYSVSLGMGWEDHSEDCLTHVINDVKARFPEVEWPDVPDSYECECERDNFSRSRCEGCGSWLHGERHAMTLFKQREN